MKKILLILLPLLFVTLLSAGHLTPGELKGNLDFSYGGEFRTRAILQNDLAENDGGWLDNRLRLDFYAKMGEKVGFGWSPEIGYNVFEVIGNGGWISTRELYMDYAMDMMEADLRFGRQYWTDHRSLVLDDYYAGVSANMELMGMNTDFGFIKVAEGNKFEYNDNQAFYGTISGEAPINWGTTLMFGQNHGARTADIWLIPYAEVVAGPANLDLTLVINNQMFKDAAGDDDSAMGIGFALKAGMDLGFKLGLDLLYVTEDGINSYSSYYDNGLILFGNKDAFQGTQIMPAPYDWGTSENCMAIAVSATMPLSEQMEVYANAGMVTIDDPIGTELNIGMNYEVVKGVKFCPVLAVGQSGKAIDSDENMVYMLGGLLKAEF